MKKIQAKYVTVWDSGLRISANCEIDISVRPVRLMSVESVYNPDIQAGNIIEEYITHDEKDPEFVPVYREWEV